MAERRGSEYNIGSMRTFNSFLLQAKTGLPRCFSDYSAILLGEQKVDLGPSPFRFYNEWLEDGEMMKQASEGWIRCKTEGSTGFVLSSKLKFVKERMQRYILTKKKDSFSMKEVEARLQAVESKAICDGWTETLRKERMDILSDLWNGVRKEEQA
ncbi:hypothetical protein Dsin_019224 [Dipteronia sinensis]|uniref:Uncharacterized protein n=1 Tax=Dipteronia sinensis TaxID=43782 RepID=A0AAE0A882_9ROSI|nr:hypothetical protein Dsin_019224 [Dipteronia sinensis]